MTLINTDGMALIGPGSEWFWTAVSGLVLATTFLAIYRQLRLQAHASAVEQLNAFDREAASERTNRAKTTLLIALRDGKNPVDLPDAAAGEVAASWGGSRRWPAPDTWIPAGRGMTGWFAESWWLQLGPWIVKKRVDRADPTYYANLDGLAASCARWTSPPASRPQRRSSSTGFVEDVIAELRDMIRTEELLRSADAGSGVSGIPPAPVAAARRPRQRPAAAR